MPFECRQQVPKDCRASGAVNNFFKKHLYEMFKMTSDYEPSGWKSMHA